MYSLLKFIAFSAAIPLALLPNRLYFAIAFGMSLAHFWLGAYYGIPLLKKVATHRRGQIFLGLFAILTIAAFVMSSSTQNRLLFGLHFALTEAFFGLARKPDAKLSKLVFFRGLFEFIAYLPYAFRVEIFKTHEQTWYLALALSFGLYVFFLSRAAKQLGQKTVVDLLLSQILTLVIFYIAFYVLNLNPLMAFFLVVTTHGNIWFLYPLFRDGYRWTKKAAHETWIHVAVTAGLVCISVPVCLLTDGGFKLFGALFIFWFYFHTFFGFASSFANPAFVRRFFKYI